MNFYTSHFRKQTKIQKLILFIVILLLVNVSSNIDMDSLSQIQCLIQKNVTRSCIDSLDSERIFKNNLQATVYICPVLIKFYQQNEHQRSDVYEKIQKLCKLSTQVDRDNGYLLLGLYIMKNSFINALKLQYNLFFNEPFKHQQKLRQIISHYGKQIEGLQKQKHQNQLQELNQGIRALYQNRVSQATQLIDKICKEKKLQDRQLNLLALFLKIRIMQKNNQFPQALSIVDQVISDQKNQVHWYLYHLKGNLLMHHIKFKEAIQAFEASIRLKNHQQKYFTFSLYNIGLCYQKINEYKKSINYLRKVLNINPDCEQALNSMGFTYSSLISQSNSQKQNKQYIKLAQNYYQKSIASNDKYFVSYYNYGILKFQLKQYGKAADLFQKSLKINSNTSNTSSKYGLFKSLYKINKPSGLKYLQQHILTSKDHLLYDIGILFYQLDQYNIAKDYLQKAISQKYNLGEVYEWKGIIQFNLQNYDDAGVSFKKALQNGNIKSSIWFNLGYLQQLKKNYEKAVGFYKKALEKDPNGPGKQRLEQIQRIKKKKNEKNKKTQQL